MSTTLLQPYEFLGALYGGIVTGLLYGVFALIRRLFNKSALIKHLSDALFCVAAFCVCELTLYLVDDGAVAFHTLTGLALGVLVTVYTYKGIMKRPPCGGRLQ